MPRRRFHFKLDSRVSDPHIATMASKPQLITCITCDSVHIDPSTGKHFILGCFSNLRARQFPATHPRMVWFLTLTDLQPGEHKLCLSYGLNMESLQKIVERKFQSRNPLDKLNLINDLHNIKFDQPGTYNILVEVDDEPIIVTHLTVQN